MGNAVDFPGALLDVPLNAAQQANVRLHVHVQLQVHQLAQPLVVEAVDALQNQHLPGINQLLGVGAAVQGVVILLAGDGLPGHEGFHILQKQVVVENAGFVVVQQGALLKGQVGMVAVVCVLLQYKAAVAQLLMKALRQGGLAAAAGAADTDEQHDASLQTPDVRRAGGRCGG